jgi:hypothetical protein
LLDRTASDGTFIAFNRGSTSVGSIGVAFNDNLFISGNSSHSGIAFGSTEIYPSTPAGASNDAALNLGTTTTRFKDLYLSSGVYLGGTGAANKLDDYEIGTFTPTVVGTTTEGTATYAHQKGTYVKTGHLVHVQVYVNWSSGTGSGNLRVIGLPFALMNSGGYYGSASIAEHNGINGTAGHTLGGLGVPSATVVNFVESDLGSAPVGISYDSAGYIVFSMTYRAE